MNDEQRFEVYLSLINQLLSCNEGDETRILQDNQELLDQGLIETMIGVAQQFGETGRSNEAQRLMNIAQQLAEVLGLLEDETTATTNTHQDYLNFLMEVLQKISENPNPQLIYPFLAQHLDKLDENLILVLDDWAKNTLSSVDQEESEYIADVIFDFSSLIEQYSLGSIANNLEIAIIGYQIALRVLTFDTFLQDWAIIQSNIATAYSQRIKGDKADNLEQAIICYQEALKVLTFEAFPHDWAKTQSNIATTYSKRIRGDKADNLEQAIIYEKEALKVLTFESFPHDWAGTLHNLGNRYLNRIRGDKADNLEQAIICYQEALKVMTFDAFPQDWALTQNSLANAYSDRIRGDKADNLEQAIICYQEALKVRTFDAFPRNWAITEHNLAIAYSKRIRGDKADNLEQAIICYQEALKVRTFDAFPQNWALTQNNLAVAYSKRIRGDKTDNLEQAIICYQEALKVRTFDAFPQDWAITNNNLGSAYFFRIRGDKADNLEQAIVAYTEILKVRTFDTFPQDWASTQDNLGNAYLFRIKGDKANNLERAIICYQKALKVRTFDTFPQDWASTQNNLANAYLFRIKGDKANNLKQAINFYQNALKIRTKEDTPLDCLLTARNLGILYYTEHQWQPATEAYHLAIESLENARLEALNPQNRQQTLSNAIDVFYGIVQAHLNLNQPDKALEYVERSKARNLVELMTQKHLKPQEVSQATIDQWDELRQRVVNEQICLQNQRINQDFSHHDNLMPYVTDQSHLKEYQQELDDFIDQKITPFDPTFKLTQKVEPISFQEIQSLSDTETCLLQWYIMGEKILAFIVSIDTETKVWESSASDLQALSDTINNYLQLYYSKNGKQEWINHLPNLLQTFADNLHINDILNLIPKTCQHLIIIPHRYLHILPIHTFPLKNGEYFYQNFDKGIAYAPSCQILKLVKQSSQQTKLNRLFVINNPTRKDLKPLLGANLEIEKIKQGFELDQTIIIAEKEASEMTLTQRKQELQSAHCIHFSCHGKFNPESPLDSALCLADPEGNLGELANLTLAEVFEKLDLKQCRLVTFSACESGMTDPNIISDEYIGLPSGFLFAGSSSVVSTLWTVDPLATALFMSKFYHNLQRISNLDQGSIAITLNNTQTWLKTLTSKELARIKNSKKFEQLLDKVFENKRDHLKFKDLLESAVKRQPYPFENPYYWTGFIATGV